MAGLHAGMAVLNRPYTVLTLRLCYRCGGGHYDRVPSALCQWQGWLVGGILHVFWFLRAWQLPIYFLRSGPAHFWRECVERMKPAARRMILLLVTSKTVLLVCSKLLVCDIRLET